jgi:hypothetical protein
VREAQRRTGAVKHLLLLLLFTLCFWLDSIHPPTAHVQRGFWAAAIPAIISAVGGYLASRKAGKQSGTDRDIQQQQLDAMKFLTPYGEDALNKSKTALEAPLGFYSRLAHGDRNALLQELSPELQSRDASDRATLSSVSELAPRGGASSDFLSKMPFRRNTDTANMLFGARKAGFEGLGTIGTNLGSMGLNAMSGGQAGGMNLLNYGLNRNRQQFDQGSQTGAGLFQIAKAFADAYGKRKGTGDGSTSMWGQQSPSYGWQGFGTTDYT